MSADYADTAKYNPLVTKIDHVYITRVIYSMPHPANSRKDHRSLQSSYPSVASLPPSVALLQNGDYNPTPFPFYCEGDFIYRTLSVYSKYHLA